MAKPGSSDHFKDMSTKLEVIRTDLTDIGKVLKAIRAEYERREAERTAKLARIKAKPWCLRISSDNKVFAAGAFYIGTKVEVDPELYGIQFSDQKYLISLKMPLERLEIQKRTDGAVWNVEFIGKNLIRNLSIETPIDRLKVSDETLIDSVKLSGGASCDLDQLLEDLNGHVNKLSYTSTKTEILRNHHLKYNFSLSQISGSGGAAGGAVGAALVIKTELYSLNGSLELIADGVIDLTTAKLFANNGLIVRSGKNVVIGNHVIQQRKHQSDWFGHVEAPYNYYAPNGSFIAANGSLEITAARAIGIFNGEIFCHGPARLESPTLKNKAGIITIHGDLTTKINHIENLIYDPIKVTLPNTYYTYTDRSDTFCTSRASYLYVKGDFVPECRTIVTNVSSLFNIIGCVKNQHFVDYRNSTAQLVSSCYFHKGSRDSSSRPTETAGTVLLGRETTITMKNFYNSGLIACSSRLEFDIDQHFKTAAIPETVTENGVKIKPLHNNLKDSGLFELKDGQIDARVPLNSSISSSDIGITGAPLLLTPVALEYAITRELTATTSETPKQVLKRWNASAVSLPMLTDLPKDQLVKRIGGDSLTDTAIFWHSAKAGAPLVPYIATPPSSRHRTGCIVASEIIIDSGDVEIAGGAVVGEKLVVVQTKGDTTIRSLTARHSATRIIDGEEITGHADLVTAVGSLESGKDGIVLVDAGRDLKLHGARTSSGVKTVLMADGEIIDRAVTETVQLESKTRRFRAAHPRVSQHQSKGEIQMVSNGVLSLEAPQFEAKRLNLGSSSGVALMNSYHVEEYLVTQKKQSVLGITATTRTVSKQTYRPVVTSIKVGETVITGPLVQLMAPEVNGSRLIINAANAGILPVAKMLSMSELSSREGLIINRVAGRSSCLKKYIAPKIDAELVLNAKRVVWGLINNGKRPTLTLPSSASITVFSDQLIETEFSDWSPSKYAVIAAAIVAAHFAGVGGAALAGKMGLGATGTAVLCASTMAVGSTMAATMVQSKGDLAASFKALTVEQIAISAITAGVASEFANGQLLRDSLIKHGTRELLNKSLQVHSKRRVVGDFGILVDVALDGLEAPRAVRNFARNEDLYETAVTEIVM